jgi:hypothetical protein
MSTNRTIVQCASASLSVLLRMRVQTRTPVLICRLRTQELLHLQAGCIKVTWQCCLLRWQSCCMRMCEGVSLAEPVPL